MALTTEAVTSDCVVPATVMVIEDGMHGAFTCTALADPVSDELGASGESV